MQSIYLSIAGCSSFVEKSKRTKWLFAEKQQQAKSNDLKAPQKNSGRGQIDGARIGQHKTQSPYYNFATSWGYLNLSHFKHKGSFLYVPLRFGANAV